MKVKEFEQKVWEVDKIRLVIRAPASEDVGDFVQKRASTETNTISEYEEDRLNKPLAGKEWVVINGSGEIVFRGTTLRVVRATYDRDNGK